MTTANDTEVYYDPYDINITANPYPTFARLRDEAPIYYNERYDFWALSRFADVERALADWQTFSSGRGDILELVQSDFDMPPGVMMFQDPPMHTMLRGVMSQVFTRVGWPRSKNGSGGTASVAWIRWSARTALTSSPNSPR